jgi:hypothetical protein
MVSSISSSASAIIARSLSEGYDFITLPSWSVQEIESGDRVDSGEEKEDCGERDFSQHKSIESRLSIHMDYCTTL